MKANSPIKFWVERRKVVYEEVPCRVVEELDSRKETVKTLYKVKDLLELFQASKPTIYESIWEGRLTPCGIGSRVFF